jgi:plastocyanin
MKYRLLIAAAAALFAGGCGSGEATSPIADAGPTGTIRGKVRLVGNMPEQAFEPITKDQGSAVCGDKASLPRLKLGADNGVQNAFVFLDGVKPVQNMQPQKSVLVDQKDCQYAPHSLAVPVGTKLEFTNSDDILHSAVGRQDGPDGAQTLFNIAQPVKGARNLTERALSKPGVVVLTCEAGHPWMFAHVFVADHPYVDVTENSGEFVISNVPVGTHRIKMWHEGVTIRKIHKGLQLYEYEEPYEIVKDIVVEAGKEAVIDFDLELRANSL